MRIAVREHMGVWNMMYPDYPNVGGASFNIFGEKQSVLLGWNNRMAEFKDSWTIYELDEL